MARFLKHTILVSAILVGHNALAGISNDIPSCYSASNVSVPAPATDIEVFFLVDQTTPLDGALQNSVRENASSLIRPGSAFVVATFSSYSQGRYLEVLSAGTLERQILEKNRDDIGVKILRNFDACMKGQLEFGRNAAATALNQALGQSSRDLAKSDIMASLKDLSNRVRQSQAKEKIVFLISDMLENSGVSSFYLSKNVRNIEVAAELKKASDNQLIGDFGGARIFVLGAGLVQENAGGKIRDSGVYRDPRTMSNLRQFWEQYFARSNAKLIEFGAPALLVPVQ